MPCLWRNNQRLAMAIHDRIGLLRQRLFVGGKGRRLEMTIRGTRGPPLWSCSCSSSCRLRKSAQPSQGRGDERSSAAIAICPKHANTTVS
jgi:hypothetical protein